MKISLLYGNTPIFRRRGPIEMCAKLKDLTENIMKILDFYRNYYEIRWIVITLLTGDQPGFQLHLVLGKGNLKGQKAEEVYISNLDK